MRNNIRSMLAVSGGYAAAVIGAGFASGQEIVSFFVRQGRAGMIGILIACAAFSLFSYAVLSVCAEEEIYSFSDFLELIFPNKIMNKAARVSVLLCSAASFCVMTACAGEVGKIVTGAEEIIGAAVFTVLCAVIFFLDGRKVMGINSSLGIILIMGIIFTCFYILRFREHQTFSPEINAASSGLTYAGYNLIGTGAVLSMMSRSLKSKGEAALSSAVSGVVLFIMITLIWAVLIIYYGQINLGEIPMLTMAFRQNNILGIFYAAMLAAAVITTGISNGFSLIDILSRRTGKSLAIILVSLFGFCASGAGFSYLIDTAYRICGYIGALVAFVIMACVFFILKNQEKWRKQE